MAPTRFLDRQVRGNSIYKHWVVLNDSKYNCIYRIITDCIQITNSHSHLYLTDSLSHSRYSFKIFQILQMQRRHIGFFIITLFTFSLITSLMSTLWDAIYIYATPASDVQIHFNPFTRLNFLKVKD